MTPCCKKVEQAVCSSEYPFVKFLLGSYRNYWKARLSGIRTAFFAVEWLQFHAYRIGGQAPGGGPGVAALCGFFRGV